MGSTVLNLEEVGTCEGELRAQVKRLYERGMITQAPAAATDHMLALPDLTRLLARATVRKVLAFVGTELAGVGLLSSDLGAVPGISPQFFVSRYPDETERGTLWYAISAVVDPDFRRGGVLDALGEKGAEILRREGAEVLVWSASASGLTMMEWWTQRVIQTAFGDGATSRELDRQVYMGTRLPGPGAVVIDLRRRDQSGRG